MLRKITLLCIIVCFWLFIFAIFREKSPDSQLKPIQFSRKAEPDIDMFMGSWKESVPRKIHGSLEVWDILTKCDDDPLRPTKKGAVLTDINSVSFAILKTHESTTPSTLKEVQQIFYIVSGEGIIKSGNKSADLHEGIGVIMVPGIEFIMTNTGNEQLTMYIVEEPIPEGFIPNKEMVVKDEYDNPISTNIHRVNDSNRWLFDRNDGLSTLVAINPIMNEPKSFYPLHVHKEGDEEVWVTIRGEVLIQVGKQRRKLPGGSAYKVPASGTTPHTNINNTDNSQKLLWLMKVPTRQIMEVPTRKKPKKLQNVI